MIEWAVLLVKANHLSAIRFKGLTQLDIILIFNIAGFIISR